MHILNVSVQGGTTTGLAVAVDASQENLALLGAALFHHDLVVGISVVASSNMQPGPTPLGRIFILALKAMEHGLANEATVPLLNDHIARAVREITKL